MVLNGQQKFVIHTKYEGPAIITKILGVKSYMVSYKNKEIKRQSNFRFPFFRLQWGGEEEEQRIVVKDVAM